MDTLLRAVGLSQAPPRLAAPGSVGRKYPHELTSEEAASELVLPDLASIAAATEQGILQLEEEARGLERNTRSEALSVLRRWGQGLRRKPRADEPLASFRAQYLRSNTLERALEAVRRNDALWNELLDPPVKPTSSTKGEETLETQLRQVLQLCLPRSASSLASPLLRTVLIERPECASAAIMTIRLLKEDWIEVVQAQALRGLERQLDKVVYEMQKAPSHKARHPFSSSTAAIEQRKASHDRIIVLALICEALEQLQRRMQARFAEIGRSLNDMGVDAVVEGQAPRPPALSMGAMTSCTSCASDAGPFRGIASPNTLDKDASAGQGHEASLRISLRCDEEDEAPSGGTPLTAANNDVPSEAECEAAISLMLKKTEAGMEQGLRALGLPSTPVRFIPGQELSVGGLDIRVVVNEMLTHWVEENRSEFLDALARLRMALAGATSGAEAFTDRSRIDVGRRSSRGEASNQDVAGALDDAGNEAKLLRLRGDLIRERAELQFRIRRLDERIAEVDFRLNDLGGESSAGPLLLDPLSLRWPPTPASSSMAREPASTQAPSSHRSAGACSSQGASLPPPLPVELAPLVASAAEVLSVDALRSRERLALQVLKRRSQLLASLSEHLTCEKGRLESAVMASLKALTTSEVPSQQLGSFADFAQQMNETSQEARALCGRVKAVVGGASSPVQALEQATDQLTVGDRCRARWLDGNFYDAAVQKLPGDGTVVVNWLRPKPVVVDEGPDSSPPLVTISEAGGDDSLHRIVGIEDIQTIGTGASSPTSQRASKIFEDRSSEDMSCAECDTYGATWASVSFGIYLCAKCAELHRRLGVRVSLVRPLGEGWAWDRSELEYLTCGGNSAFHAHLDVHPVLKSVSVAERYVTRFAEHYRRHLDALCSGVALPNPISAEVACQPAIGDFLSKVEAVAVVQEMGREFEEATQALSVHVNIQEVSCAARIS